MIQRDELTDLGMIETYEYFVRRSILLCSNTNICINRNMHIRVQREIKAKSIEPQNEQLIQS